MATIRNNALINGLSGSIGNLVFRQFGGKTILSGKASPSRKQSNHQRENRNKFRQASCYAKISMLNAEKKAYYWRMAKKLKLPNAYTAAISDYMRNGEITEINTQGYKGRVGNQIRIKARKKDFAVHRIKVMINDGDGKVIDSGFAFKKRHDVFIYTLMKDLQDNVPLVLQASFEDEASAQALIINLYNLPFH